MCFFVISELFFCFFISAHCLYQGLLGKGGYFVIEHKLKPRLKALRHEQALLANRRKRLVQKVTLLRNAIDPDLLEQYEWKSLGRIPKDKKIIFLSEKNAKKGQ
jgi:cell division protein FtsB